MSAEEALELLMGGVRDEWAAENEALWDGIETEEEDDLEKGRTYVDDPSEAPEGVELQEGPQGGLYYEEGSSDNPHDLPESEHALDPDDVEPADFEASFEHGENYSDEEVRRGEDINLPVDPEEVIVTESAVDPDRVEWFMENGPGEHTSDPIQVKQEGGKYYVVDGHHRLVAARLLGMEDVPAVLVEGGRLEKAAEDVNEDAPDPEGEYTIPEEARFEVHEAFSRWKDEATEEDKHWQPFLYWLLGSGTPDYKMSKALAAYQDPPVASEVHARTPGDWQLEERCDGCEYFYTGADEKSICSQVRGEVHAQGWCKLWEPVDGEMPDYSRTIPNPMEKEWVPYEGPKGGQGWIDQHTGDVLYQDEPPDESADELRTHDVDVVETDMGPTYVKPNAHPEEVTSAMTAHGVLEDIGVPVPEHRTEDGHLLVEGIPGTSLRLDEVDPRSIDRDSFITAWASQILIGNYDLHEDQFVVDEEGTVWPIDLDQAGSMAEGWAEGQIRSGARMTWMMDEMEGEPVLDITEEDIKDRIRELAENVDVGQLYDEADETENWNLEGIAINAEFAQTGELLSKQNIPEEHREYMDPSEVPEGVEMHTGARGGTFVDRRQLEIQQAPWREEMYTPFDSVEEFNLDAPSWVSELEPGDHDDFPSPGTPNSWVPPDGDEHRYDVPVLNEWVPEHGLVSMSPQEYMEAVSEGFDTPVEEQYGVASNQQEKVRERFEEGLPVDPAWLEYNVDTGEMKGQEGRNRSVVAEDMGIEEIPVVVRYVDAAGNKVDPETYTPPTSDEIEQDLVTRTSFDSLEEVEPWIEAFEEDGRRVSNENEEKLHREMFGFAEGDVIEVDPMETRIEEGDEILDYQEAVEDGTISEDEPLQVWMVFEEQDNGSYDWHFETDFANLPDNPIPVEVYRGDYTVPDLYRSYYEEYRSLPIKTRHYLDALTGEG